MTIQALSPYVPKNALAPCHRLIRSHHVEVRIVKQRRTRHGDYRKLENGSHRITINATPNPYRFLLTLIHEIAHLVAFERYGRTIKPHGQEWKQTFTLLMAPLISLDVWPEELLPLVAGHFRNPKASSSTDLALALALKKHDPPTSQVMVSEIEEGMRFRLHNGKLFRKGKQRVKRFECLEIGSGRVYLFQPHAEVEPMNET